MSTPVLQATAAIELPMNDAAHVIALAWALYRKVTLYGAPLYAEALRVALAPLFWLAAAWIGWMRVMVP